MERRKKNRKYDRQFKENAVKLSIERENVASVARELGISEWLLTICSKLYLVIGDFFCTFDGLKTTA
jgi:transposase